MKLLKLNLVLLLVMAVAVPVFGNSSLYTEIQLEKNDSLLIFKQIILSNSHFDLYLLGKIGLYKPLSEIGLGISFFKTKRAFAFLEWTRRKKRYTIFGHLPVQVNSKNFSWGLHWHNLALIHSTLYFDPPFEDHPEYFITIRTPLVSW